METLNGMGAALAEAFRTDHPDNTEGSSVLCVALGQVEIGPAQEMDQAPTWKWAI